MSAKWIFYNGLLDTSGLHIISLTQSYRSRLWSRYGTADLENVFLTTTFQFTLYIYIYIYTIFSLMIVLFLFNDYLFNA